ncbi:hypothetical protein ACRAWF_22930, partial [Streptomyces sp. L7]
MAYARVTPFPVEIVRYSKLSLVGQPDPEDHDLVGLLGDAGLADPAIQRVGIVGWKYFTGNGAADYIDAPHFLVAALEQHAGRVENATDLLVHPDYGLRIVNDVHQIAYFEFAAGHGSQAMLRLLDGIRPGQTELEASSLMRPVMLPFNYHPTMLGGREHTSWGVASPSGRE